MDMEKLMADFAAKGGAVKKIEIGIRRYNEKDMFNAIRGELKSESDYTAESEKLFHEIHDQATEARLNGHRVTGYDSAGNVYIGNGKKY